MVVSKTEDGLPPIVAERRNPSRRKAFLGGLAVSREGMLAIDCTIRDISASGVRVKVGYGQVLPERFYLIINGKDYCCEAIVVWMRRGEFGVKFGATHTLESLEVGDLTFLRRLIVERMPRVSVV